MFCADCRQLAALITATVVPTAIRVTSRSRRASKAMALKFRGPESLRPSHGRLKLASALIRNPDAKMVIHVAAAQALKATAAVLTKMYKFT